MVWGLLLTGAPLRPQPPQLIPIETKIVIEHRIPEEPDVRLTVPRPVITTPAIPDVTIVMSQDAPRALPVPVPALVLAPIQGTKIEGPHGDGERPAPVPPSLPADYLMRLLAHLSAYKRYPYDARLRHEQGTVRLRFTMDRMGHVTSYQVVGSSGFSELDDEAGAMITQAQPLPPVPSSYPGATVDLVLPLVFSLH